MCFEELVRSVIEYSMSVSNVRLAGERHWDCKVSGITWFQLQQGPL